MNLDEFKKLNERAAPGPWLAVPEGVHTPHEYIDCFSTSGFTTPNAAFIAACRHIVPKLIAVAEAAANPFIEPTDMPAREECEAYNVLRAALDAL